MELVRGPLHRVTLAFLAASLVHAPREAFAAQDPDTITDAPAVVFVSEVEGGAGVFRLDRPGGEPRLLAAGELCLDPQVSPDGEWLVYLGAREEDFALLETSDLPMHFLLYGRELAGGEDRLLTRTPVAADSVEWSPDSQSLVFVSSLRDERSAGREGVVDSDVFVVARDGTGERRINLSDGYQMGPHWSPDGRRLLFRSRRVEDRTAPVQLLWMHPDGGSLRVLTPKTPGVLAACWTADGDSVVFQEAVGGLDALRDSHLVRIRADGTGRTEWPLSATPVGLLASGKELLVLAETLAVLDLDSGKRVAFGEEGVPVREPRLTADRRQVLCILVRDGHPRLASRSVDADHWVEWTDGSIPLASPAWAPRVSKRD